MLNLIPPALFQIILRIVHGLRSRYWRMFRPHLSGCRALVLDDAGHILLIRHSYGNRGWMLPGGGMKRGEDALLCAAREVWEETGVRLTDAQFVTISQESAHGAPSAVHIVRGRGAGGPCPDGREVVAAAYFARDAFPPNMVCDLDQKIEHWLL